MSGPFPITTCCAFATMCYVPGPVNCALQPPHLHDTPDGDTVTMLILRVGNERLGSLCHRPKAHRASRVGI